MSKVRTAAFGKDIDFIGPLKRDTKMFCVRPYITRYEEQNWE
jgi:hypothetical protein